jgi:cell division protein FtsZ
MAEVTEATTKIYEEVHDEANIILGVIFDESLGDELLVTVIATGIRDTIHDIEELPDKAHIVQKKKETTIQALPFRKCERNLAEGSAVVNGMRRSFASNILSEQDYDRPTFLRRNES